MSLGNLIATQKTENAPDNNLTHEVTFILRKLFSPKDSKKQPSSTFDASISMYIEVNGQEFRLMQRTLMGPTLPKHKQSGIYAHKIAASF